MSVDTVLCHLERLLGCDGDAIHSYEVWDKVIFVRFYDRRPTFVSKALFAKDSMYAIGVLYRAILEEKPKEEIKRIKRHLYPAYLFQYYNRRDILQEVREAFGSGTWVYEGFNNEELLESIRCSVSLNDWCRVKCIMEEKAGLKERLQRAGLLD